MNNHTFTDKVEQRISLITLGVKNLPLSRKFYEGLGWKAAENSSDESIAFFQLGSTALALFPIEQLLSLQQKSDIIPVSGAITLGYNTRSRQEVDEIINLAVKLGGTLRP